MDLQTTLICAEHCSVHGLTVTRWKRYGYDRLYVLTTDSRRVGYLDLQTGAIRLEMPALAQSFDAALMEHFGIAPPQGLPGTRPNAAACDTSDRPAVRGLVAARTRSACASR